MGKFVDFKKLAEDIDITDVAAHVGLKLKPSGKDLRTTCPVCDTDDERSLAVVPETNSFRCYAAQISGDCISLYAHVKETGNYKAACLLAELFSGTVSDKETVSATAPQKPRAEPTAPLRQAPKPEGFDPAAIAVKLAYTQEVAALGISEEDAGRLGIGFYAAPGFLRGRVAFPVRNEAGAIVGYIGYQAGGNPPLKVPSRWHGIETNVVKFPQTA